MSSSAVDIVKAYFGTFSLMTADKAGLFLADDFKLVGLGENPYGKDLWVRMMNALKVAMPDMKIKLSDIQMDGNIVNLTQFTKGTHRGPLDLSELSLPVIPPTEKEVIFPGSQWAFTVVAGKITEEKLIAFQSKDTGLAGILKAFG